MKHTKWYKCTGNLPETPKSFEDRTNGLTRWSESDQLLLYVKGEPLKDYYRTGIYVRGDDYELFQDDSGEEYGADEIIAWKHIEPFEEELQDAERD